MSDEFPLRISVVRLCKSWAKFITSIVEIKFVSSSIGLDFGIPICIPSYRLGSPGQFDHPIAPFLTKLMLCPHVFVDGLKLILCQEGGWVAPHGNLPVMHFLQSNTLAGTCTISEGKPGPTHLSAASATSSIFPASRCLALPRVAITAAFTLVRVCTTNSEADGRGSANDFCRSRFACRPVYPVSQRTFVCRPNPNPSDRGMPAPHRRPYPSHPNRTDCAFAAAAA